MTTANSGRFKKGDPQTREAGRKGGQASGQTRAAKSAKSRSDR